MPFVEPPKEKRNSNVYSGSPYSQVRLEALEEYLTSEEGQQDIIDLVLNKHCTIRAICHNFGVSPQKFYKMLDEHPDLSDALRSSERVEMELHEESLRYLCTSHKRSVTFVEKDPDGKTTKITKRIEDIDPDLATLKYVLENRYGERWRSKQELSLSADEPIAIFVDTFGYEKEGDAKEDDIGNEEGTKDG